MSEFANTYRVEIEGDLHSRQVDADAMTFDQNFVIFRRGNREYWRANLRRVVSVETRANAGAAQKAADGYKRFEDGRLKPFLEPHRYDELRNDDTHLYNRGPKPEGLV